MRTPLGYAGLLTFTLAICGLIALTGLTAESQATPAEPTQLPAAPTVSADFFTAFAHATR